ncbi:MFS transporter, DHA1 family, tetracycline resistance protein [Catalinimonas alkaloidigena]|uniref:MFS transporter, DHA1 family, tetracycline resistance protein n=1 Tax=Catalinimonas alkaloidigena TaxID=1075417 RepID=A0A1G9T4N0_9BACT|nr:TCR/Tet family MFS transporter [Catalinimonas alkaloidigena]SDM42704.1 MFS transporter, DHA1 family, tetracycline resistance protein [Catalinimonas alkaloidigena]
MSSPSHQAEPRKAALGFIFVTLLIDVIGLGIIAPVLPTLITELIHDDLSQAATYGGWLLFAYAFMQFLCAPVVGGLSDRYGRRPVLLASLFGFGVDYLFLAFAPTIGWLFIGRIVAGVMGASFTTASAYIADVSPPEKRAQNFGMIGAAFGVGFVIGPVLGGVLGQYGSRIPFLAAAGLTFLNFLYGYFILPESLTAENRRAFRWKRANPIGSLQQARRYPVLMGLLASLVLIYLAAHAPQSTWSYFTMERFGWSEAQVGFSLGALGLLVGVVQGFLTRFTIPKLGMKRSIFVGFAFYMLGFLLFSFATQGWQMYIFLVPYALGGISGPALQGLLSTQVPANEQGELQGALTSLISVTSILGPPLMTNLFAYFTGDQAPFYFPGAPFLMGAVLIVLSIVLAVAPLRRLQEPAKQEQAA